MDSFIKSELAKLLRHRLGIIADHALRDRDPGEHLAQLSSVSGAIEKAFQEHRKGLPPRLCHFLSQASFHKALEYLQNETEG
ncbi:MAG: hypothetical protein JWO89_1546 [Verrucomicrobiaceae bacterium]|nr:hypothetical protein [Verrucomicrobiaceae bacterium]MDB6116377.1 hypothetical protein [Verrucomicrobiaceae bacterium]